MAATGGLQYNERSGFLVGEVITDEIDRLVDELQALRAIEANTAMAVKLLQAMANVREPDEIGRFGALPPTLAANDSKSAEEQRQPAAPGAPDSQRQDAPAAAPSQPATINVEGASLQLTRAPDAPPNTPSVTRPADDQGEPRTQSIPAEAAPTHSPAPSRAAAPVSARRDSTGRFTSEPGAGRRPDEANDPSRGGTLSAIRSIASAVKEATASASEGSENIDPTIQAAKEVGGILSPAKALLRPLGGLFGRSKEAKEAKQHREQVTWLRRIWRGQADAGKGGASGGILRLLGMLLPMLGLLLAPLKALGRLTGLAKLLGAAGGLGRAVFSRGRRSVGSAGGGRRGGFWRGRNSAEPGAARAYSDRARAGTDVPGRSERAGSAGAGRKGRIGQAVSKAGGMLGSAGSMLKGGAGALVKKLPLIGALVGGGMLASSLMKDAKTPEEKRDKYAGVGSAAGSLVGGALGMIGGPVGMMAGSYIGEIIGEKVGTWLAGADLGAMVDNVTGMFRDMASAAGEMASKAWDYVSGAWSGMIDGGVKLFTGMQTWFSDKLAWIGDELSQIKDSVKDKVQDAAYTVRDKVSNGASTVADTGRNVLNKITGGRYTGGSNAAKSQMVSAMAEAGITDPKSQAALMANVDHETGGFKRFDENLNYSAERLQKVFPKYYKNADDARADAGNAEAIANRVYGGRMGNTDPGDGFKFRGRGMIQLTGKSQYESMGKKLGVDLVNNPELAADPKIAAKIAAEYWKSSGADKAAQAGDFTAARKKVNGGTNGLEDTMAKTQGYLAQANAGELTAPQTADKSKVQAPVGAQNAISGTIAAVKARQAHQEARPVGVLASTAIRTPVSISAPTGETQQIRALQPSKPAENTGSAPTGTAAPGIFAAAKKSFTKTAAVPASLAPAAQPVPLPPTSAVAAKAPEAPQSLKGTPVMPLAAAAAPTVPASPVAAPPVIAAPTAPAVPASVKSISYQAPAPDANLSKVPVTPEVRTPPAPPSSSGPATTQPLAPLTQGVADRQIAHVAAGGLGMGLAQL